MAAKAGPHATAGRNSRNANKNKDGEDGSWKKLEVKISRHCLFNSEIIQITEYFMQKLLEDS
jgi:hypothetical protein